MARRRYHPPASNAATRRRMKSQLRRDTACEIALRRAVHAVGLRYRLHRRPVESVRREADLVFGAAGVAVFVDGCFWHGCGAHFRPPKANREWWRRKLAMNRARDKETDRVLSGAGWRVVRVWEHEDPTKAARRVLRAVRASKKARQGTRSRRNSVPAQ